MYKYFLDDESIDVINLDMSKDLKETKSCLEFFVVAIGKSLSLSPKQVKKILIKF